MLRLNEGVFNENVNRLAVVCMLSFQYDFLGDTNSYSSVIQVNPIEIFSENI